MGVKYTWVINKMKTIPSSYDLTNVVVSINYTRTAENGEYLASTFPSDMICASPSPSNFTPYYELTYEQVCNWLDSGVTDLIAIDKNLYERLDRLANLTTIVLKNPWE
jgi:hypothetical protein